MDVSAHSINTLFQQLGLPSEESEIDSFCTMHRLSHDMKLVEAEFWTEAQVAFLSEALEQDADWVEIVDQLDVRLRG